LNYEFISLLSAVFLLAGALFSFIASLGLLRLPDLFSRMHAASKAGTAGSGLVLIAAALHAGAWDVWVKCIAVIVFFVLTTPLSAHLLAKAALAAGAKPRFLDRRDGQ
jgi:multicomponent Na+:H+ antiporter subunit G